MPASEAYLRDLKKVHVVFAISSVALFLVTIWMMGADNAREWTGYQRTFEKALATKTIAAREAITSSPQYRETKEELDAKIAAATAQLEQMQPDIDRLTADLKNAEREFDRVSRLVRAARAER